MDDEVDYMSDEFLTSCLGGASSDVRPGLLYNRRDQRNHELVKKKQSASAQKKKSTEIYQAEALEEGLKQPIDSSNKGFSMLQKLGFKSGMGLGKNSDGIVEPIALRMKNNKRGLGHDAPKRTIISKKESEKKLNQMSESDFTVFHSNKIRKRKVLSDLRKSQKICKELDLKYDKSEPVETWFWPVESSVESEESEKIIEEAEEEEEGEELTTEEMLETLTKYLRQTYYYCIWCSIQFEDEKDMKDCPGETRDSH